METKQQKHTELPWLWDELDETLRNSKGHVVLHAKYVVQDRDMNHIVLSANYHERLVETLKAFTESRAVIESAMQSHGPFAECLCNGCHLKRMFDGAESLLAEIEREEK